LGSWRHVMEAVSHYFYELGLLKRIRRTGWWVAGVRDPESVAEHTFRAAVLGFVLANLEGADPYRTAVMCLIHDLPETRIGDLHRLNRQYLDPKDPESMAFTEQSQSLPPGIAEQFRDLFCDFEASVSREAVVARDADLLECLIQAREYQAQGCSSVADWINNAFSQLRTSSARRLAEVCMSVDPKDWWHAKRP
jgi:putative hydrolase of HD superfamily